MTLFYLLLFCSAFVSYICKKYQSFMFLFFGLMTNFFMLDTSKELQIRSEDLGLGLVIILLPFVYIRDRSIFSIHNDKIAKWIYIYTFLYWIELCVSVFMGVETLFNSIKVIRVSFMLWGYFIFKSIPVKCYKNFLSLMLIITIIQAFLFFLQFFGVGLLTGSEQAKESSDELGINFAINIPTLTVFYLFFSLRAGFSLRMKISLIFVFALLIFLTFVRGLIISVLVALAYYVFAYVDKKQRVFSIVALLMCLLVASFVVNKKSNASGGDSASSQVLQVLSNPGNLGYDDRNNGSMIFRMAMLTERILYLVDNPQYLLTGVGTMHEDSPQTISKFNFMIGTVNEDRALGRTIIESGDITWAPIILRYGLIGVFIHLMMLVVLFNEARKRKDILAVLSCVTIQVFGGSFNGALFEIPLQLFLLALFCAMVSRAKMENKYLNF